MQLNLTRIGAVHDLIHDTRWSGDQLAAETHRRASVLQRYLDAGTASGPASGENRFVIAHGNSPAFFADLFAVWEVGGCAVCVNPGLTAGELANVVEFVSARAVLVADANGDTRMDSQANTGLDAQLETGIVPVLCTATEARAADADADYNATSGHLAGQAAHRPSSGGLDEPALMLFTSGTTGDPKGVVHSHRSILARLALNQAHIGPDALARSLCVLPTHFGHGLIGNCLTPLLAGADLYLMHGGGVAASSRLGKVLDQHRITFISSVPAFWKLALRLSQPPTAATLRRVHIGSAPLSAELWRAVLDWSGADEVVNMYGITETANWIGGASSAQFEPQDGLLGTPWGGHYAVLGKDGQPSAEGAGEILLQVPSLMSGYFRRPDLSTEVLRDGWYHSGDTGRIDSHGVLRLTGRNRYAINRGGIKIYPEELDLLLERHPDVLEACAFGIKDPVSGEAVAAAVQLCDGSELSAPALITWMRERIRPDAVPARIFTIDEIPKTDRGKLNRDIVARFCTGETSA